MFACWCVAAAYGNANNRQLTFLPIEMQGRLSRGAEEQGGVGGSRGEHGGAGEAGKQGGAEEQEGAGGCRRNQGEEAGPHYSE